MSAHFKDPFDGGEARLPEPVLGSGRRAVLRHCHCSTSPATMAATTMTARIGTVGDDRRFGGLPTCAAAPGFIPRFVCGILPSLRRTRSLERKPAEPRVVVEGGGPG